MTYAANTSVPVDRSKTEIEHLLTRYGAEQFGYMTEGGSAVIGFKMHERMIRMRLPLPTESECARDGAGRRRTAAGAQNAFEQLKRARWRALVLICKAKLESIEAGVATFDEEWLPYTIVPGTGKTVSEEIGKRLTEAYETGRSPTLLLGMDGGE